MTVERRPDLQDPVVLEHDDAVAPERVGAALEADHPPAPDEGAHGQASFG